MYVAKIEDYCNLKGKQEELLDLFGDFLINEKVKKKLTYYARSMIRSKRIQKRLLTIYICGLEPLKNSSLLSWWPGRRQLIVGRGQKMASQHLLIIQHRDLTGKLMTTLTATQPRPDSGNISRKFNESVGKYFRAWRVQRCSKRNPPKLFLT